MSGRMRQLSGTCFRVYLADETVNSNCEISQVGKYLNGMPLVWVNQPSLLLGII